MKLKGLLIDTLTPVALPRQGSGGSEPERLNKKLGNFLLGSLTVYKTWQAAAAFSMFFIQVLFYELARWR